jgi:ribosomal protein L11 methyltransferase
LKAWPALELHSSPNELIFAVVDDYAPTAIEERDDTVRVFFTTATARDAACAALRSRFDVTAIDVPDEDWGRRSQENLAPITIGRVTIVPNPESLPHPDSLAIVIRPSMGFGTGHHATTRLCLAALQTIDLTGKTVLDVGTGSGVLAIVANRLGAARAIGIDHDPDAIHAARENLALNPDARHVTFDLADLGTRPLPAADVVTANLTGVLLARSAAVLLAAARAGGTLILSGLLAHERDGVCRAFAPAPVVWEREEDGWIGLAVKSS